MQNKHILMVRMWILTPHLVSPSDLWANVSDAHQAAQENPGELTRHAYAAAACAQANRLEDARDHVDAYDVIGRSDSA